MIDDKINNQIIFEVSSWGEKYYMKYDEYLEYVKTWAVGRQYTSNIVMINLGE